MHELIAYRYLDVKAQSYQAMCYPHDMDSAGERLKHARLAAGFKTIAEAARVKRFHKQNLADHEAERRGISAEQAEGYGVAFRADPWWILSGKTGDRAAVLGKMTPGTYSGNGPNLDLPENFPAKVERALFLHSPSRISGLCPPPVLQL